MEESDKGLSCNEVHWNPCDPMLFVVASKDNYKSPIKIWDVRNNQNVLYEFGNGKGVSSLSWSSSGLITTTDVDGVIDCWKLDDNLIPVSWSSSSSGFQEARWCQSGATLAAVSSHSLEVYKMPADRCVWPRKP
ncbi:hypothetical protein C2845_PM13G05520 [Panicum miliaceum]|uniref:Uncharacterized protein n=1 Tax=Panicum miliaceum TaxID=4540 RepID=A0A3L6RLB3_PANMI|nr:hypothetical protein C2845_PM13G05520 [Panicum miliaceum]